jgi:hypothetical protein
MGDIGRPRFGTRNQWFSFHARNRTRPINFLWFLHVYSQWSACETKYETINDGYLGCLRAPLEILCLIPNLTTYTRRWPGLFKKKKMARLKGDSEAATGVHAPVPCGCGLTGPARCAGFRLGPPPCRPGKLHFSVISNFFCTIGSSAKTDCTVDFCA